MAASSDSTGFGGTLSDEWVQYLRASLANPGLIPFEGMPQSQNTPELLSPSALPDLNLYELLGTPWDAFPPQIAAPGLCAVCTAPVSTLPPQPAPQPATFPPPGWQKIPQKPYDHGRKQWDFKPSEPVSFSANGFPGINMGDALRKKFTDLDGRDDLVLQHSSTAASCRLLYPGYPPNRAHQIFTTYWTKKRDPITRSNLAYQVARKLEQYLDSMAKFQTIDESTDKRWEIGKGFMHLNNMFLVRLESVSKGSFQPEIWVVDPRM